MANGDDKNWVRICIAIDGFRGRYGHWPTAVRLPPDCFQNVVGHVLTPIGFALVSSIVAFVPENNLSERMDIIAVGEPGEAFSYGDENKEERPPEPRTAEYFGPLVLRSDLGSGLEGVTIHDADGNLVWAGQGVRSITDQVPSAPKPATIQLTTFLSQLEDGNAAKTNPVVACNALYKNATSFNCYLTPPQAIALANHLIEKAHLIIDEGLADTAVQLWNKGAANERLYCGLIKSRKGPRKGSKKSLPKSRRLG